MMKKILVIAITLMMTGCFSKGNYQEAVSTAAYNAQLVERNNQLTKRNAELQAQIDKLNLHIQTLQERLVNTNNERVLYEAVAGSTATMNGLVRYHTYKPTYNLAIIASVGVLLVLPGWVVGIWYVINNVIAPRLKRKPDAKDIRIE